MIGFMISVKISVRFGSVICKLCMCNFEIVQIDKSRANICIVLVYVLWSCRDGSESETSSTVDVMSLYVHTRFRSEKT